MKNIILHLMLVLCIAFSPVGQSIATDMSDTDNMMTSCLNCHHNQDLPQKSCLDASCVANACSCSSFSLGMLFADSFLSLNQVKRSTTIFIKDQSPYFSQITLPLYRPPIA